MNLSTSSRVAAKRLERAQQRAAELNTVELTADELRRRQVLKAREQERWQEEQKEIRKLEEECNRALDDVRSDGRSLVMGFASRFSSDRRFILAASELNGDAIKSAPVQFCDDFDIVMAAVRRKGAVLEHVLGYCSTALREDRRIMLAAVAHHGVLAILPDEFKSDRAIVWAAVSRFGGSSVRHAAASLRADREFMREVVTQGGGDPLRYASEALQADRDFVLHCVRANPSNVQHASDALRDDFEVMMASLEVADGERTSLGTFKERSNGGTFEFASPALRSNPAFVIASIRLARPPEGSVGDSTTIQEGSVGGSATIQEGAVGGSELMDGSVDAKELERLCAIQGGRLSSLFQGEDVQCEVWLRRDVTLAGIGVMLRGTWPLLLPLEEDSWISMTLRDVFEPHEAALSALRADREIMLAAVSRDGAALRWASEALREDAELVRAAVAENGSALEYASSALRDDEDIVQTALGSRLRAVNWLGFGPGDKETFRSPFQFASERLRALKPMALLAVQRDGMMLRHACCELRGDKEVVLAAVTQNGDALSFASEELDAERDIVLSAVRTAGDVLQFASDDLKADAEVVLAAVSQDGAALEDASDALAG